MADEHANLERFGYVIASKRIGSDRLKVRFMYREPPDRADDSGWRFFAGDEDQEYADNPDNLAIYDVRTIAAIDPDIVPYLNREAPCAFERQSASDPFVASKD